MAFLNITLRAADGSETAHRVEGRRFSHYVNGVQFWFFYHRAPDAITYRVTHCASGKKVCDVPAISLLAAVNDWKLAAKGEIDRVSTRAGAARVASVLRAAERVEA